MKVLLLLTVFCTGCHGQLVAALEDRQVQSCIYWHGGLLSGHGVTATGGVPLSLCLAQPCQMGR